jgi:hypothetical protein
MNLDLIINSRFLTFYILLIPVLVMGILDYRKTGRKECLYYFGAYVALPFAPAWLSVVVVIYVTIVANFLPNRH